MMKNLVGHEIFMKRCLQLAALGTGHVAPNPLVGAVLVYDDHIIGEGYHQQYGKAHAEINCINSVAPENKHLIPAASLYVSLEPCAHFGKTPPCTKRIIEEKIKHVIIGSNDPFLQVNGQGIAQMKVAGIRVECGVLQKECDALNKRFFCFHKNKRPYIILKWAQTANRKMGYKNGERLFISNKLTERLVHQWRAENAAILVGTHTALLDNPRLDNRYWPGNNPIRLILDRKLKLPGSLHIFNQQQQTIILNVLKDEGKGLLSYRKIPDTDLIQPILETCYKENIQSILVEGGATLLKRFLDQKVWDEAYVITNESLYVENAIAAPALDVAAYHRTQILSDRIAYFLNKKFAHA